MRVQDTYTINKVKLHPQLSQPSVSLKRKKKEKTIITFTAYN